MKKLIAVILVIAALFALTACGKFTCELCNKEQSGKRIKTEILGEEVVICEDCNEKIESAQSIVNGVAGLFK